MSTDRLGGASRTRRGALTSLLLLALAILPGSSPAAGAEAITYFRIGTGGIGGTYFPIGKLIAQALNGAQPGLVAVAEMSNGSVYNVKTIGSGQLEAGLAQADVAFWAYTGSEIFAGQPPIANLRAIANLYPESIHIVARKNAGIRGVADLRGRRVSLDEPGSGTIVDARIVLAAYGLKEADLKPEYIKPNLAAERMAEGKLDALFFVGGYPASSISQLADSGTVVLLPVEGAAADRIVARYRFLSRSRFPAGTYGIATEVPTLDVGALLLASAALPDELVFQVTRALWRADTLEALAKGHPKGRLIRAETALTGIAMPLHSGAERYYRSVGLLH